MDCLCTRETPPILPRLSGTSRSLVSRSVPCSQRAVAGAASGPTAAVEASCPTFPKGDIRGAGSSAHRVRRVCPFTMPMAASCPSNLGAAESAGSRWITLFVELEGVRVDGVVIQTRAIDELHLQRTPRLCERVNLPMILESWYRGACATVRIARKAIAAASSTPNRAALVM